MSKERTISGEEHQAMRQAAKPKPEGKQVTVQTRWLVLAAGAVVLCAVSFWGGITYQQHRTHMLMSTTAASNGFGNQTSGRRRFGAIGQVTAISATSISVDNQRTGATSSYTITGRTTITDNGQAVAVTDIQTGDTVLITSAASGSAAAGRILVNPSFGGGNGGFGGGFNSGGPVQ
jgi:hypothetical protein